MNNLLLIVVIILATLVGGLAHTVWLQSKDLRSIKGAYNKSLSLAERTLAIIHAEENINVRKYIDMARKELENNKEGGEQ